MWLRKNQIVAVSVNSVTVTAYEYLIYAEFFLQINNVLNYILGPV